MRGLHKKGSPARHPDGCRLGPSLVRQAIQGIRIDYADNQPCIDLIEVHAPAEASAFASAAS